MRGNSTAFWTISRFMAPGRLARRLGAKGVPKHRRIATVMLAILALLVLAPLLGLGARITGLDGLAFTPTQWHAARETAFLLGGIAILAGTIGLGTAWLIAMHDFPFRRLIEIGLVLPLAFPTYLAAYVAVDLLDFFGPVQQLWRALLGAKTAKDYAFFDVRTLGGAIIVLSLVLYPYIYVPCRLVFSRSGRNVIDAARLLGARGWGLFFRIGLPLARPALLAGLVLALLETLNDLGASEYLGISSLSVVIRDLWLNRGDLSGASRLAGLLVLLVAGLLLLDARFSAPAAPPGRQAGARARRIRLRGMPALAALLLTLLPVLLGFVLPAARLMQRALLYAGYQRLDSEFLTATITSLALGGSVALTTMVLGGVLAIGFRLLPHWRLAAILPSFGYALPGIVLVLALLPVLRVIDDGISGLGLTWLISGSFAAMVYALSIRFLGIGSGQAGLALARLPLNVDHVARLHGMGDVLLAARVHLAAMRPGLMLAGLLVFIDVMKELPASLLLRPFNVETLATRAYAEASAGLFERAAPESLMILLISAISAALFARRA